jgi:hypothetical protein
MSSFVYATHQTYLRFTHPITLFSCTISCIHYTHHLFLCAPTPEWDTKPHANPAAILAARTARASQPEYIDQLATHAASLSVPPFASFATQAPAPAAAPAATSAAQNKLSRLGSLHQHRSSSPPRRNLASQVWPGGDEAVAHTARVP